MHNRVLAALHHGAAVEYRDGRFHVTWPCTDGVGTTEGLFKRVGNPYSSEPIRNRPHSDVLDFEAPTPADNYYWSKVALKPRERAAAAAAAITGKPLTKGDADALQAITDGTLRAQPLGDGWWQRVRYFGPGREFSVRSIDSLFDRRMIAEGEDGLTVTEAAAAALANVKPGGRRREARPEWHLKC